jgi:hypothetical protein
MIHGSMHQLNRLKILSILLSLLFIIATGCSPDSALDATEKDIPSQKGAPFITISTPKWFEGHTAAISITYDGGWDTGGARDKIRNVQNAVLSRGLVMDYEVVTSNYEPWKTSQAELRNQIPLGVHFFGHGHFHVAHDSLSWQECLDSFNTCYNLMKQWGLKPRAYAYPKGSGRSPITQDALKNPVSSVPAILNRNLKIALFARER